MLHFRTPRQRWKIAAILATPVALALLLPATAATFTWLNDTAAWSNLSEWVGGAAPSGAGASDIVIFGDNGGSLAYSATNDFAAPTPFLLNEILLQANTSPVTIAGNPLLLGGSAPQIIQNGAASATFTAPIQLGGTLAVGGTGSGSVTFSAVLSGGRSIVKSGPGALDFGSTAAAVPTDHTFHGGLIVNAGSVTFSDPSNSLTALRANPVTLASGTTIVTPAELRLGELSGSGSVSAQDAAGTGDGQAIVLSLIGNGTFSGNVTNTATGASVKNGRFTVRGLGTQTLTGSIQINNDMVAGHGAGLVLAGNAALAGSSAASVVLNGGSFTLDNSVTNIPNRLPDAITQGSGIDTRGGGTFSLIGNVAGTAEAVGNLELGGTNTNTGARSGALTINVTQPVGATGATTLTLASLSRDAAPTPRDSVNFGATDSTGTVLALGQAGIHPRVLFATTPALNSGGLIKETGISSTDSGVGWATVNGTDFASYNVSNGVVAATTTTVSGSILSAPAQNAFLAGNGSISVPASNVVALNSLKIQPALSGQALSIAGTGSLSTTAILLAGNTDYSIINSSGTGGITGGGGSRYFYVQSAALTVGVTLGPTATSSPTGQDSVTKSGAGALILTGSNTALTKTLTINDGTVRATPGSSLPAGKIELRGGVLEITGAPTYSATVGSAKGNVDWGDPGTATVNANSNDRGSGGFSAFGSAVTVNLTSVNGDNNLEWEQAGFVNSGFALVFGSTRSNARVELTDNIGLTQTGLNNDANYNLREIRVIDNPSSTADFTRLSGVISGSVREDLLKTGSGMLELTRVNTFTGGLVIAEGSLLTNNANGIGASNGAYILLGARSGSASSALLTSNTSGTVTIARGIDVLAGTTGNAILGNTTAPGAASAGNAVFSGNILLGTDGSNVNRRLQLTAETGTNVTVSGAISALTGYSGTIDVEKVGPGAATLTGGNTYSGPTTVTAGTLFVNGSISGSIATVKNGSTLGGNGVTGGLSIASGGILSPGDIAGHTSILSTGSLAFSDSTSKLTLEIGGLTAGGNGTAGYDQLNVTGGVSLAGATLQTSLLNSFVVPLNSLLFIINNDASDAIVGTFSGLAEGAQFTIGSQTFQIGYAGNSAGGAFTGGNDVVLKAVPEPGIGLLACSAMALLGIWRRRGADGRVARR